MPGSSSRTPTESAAFQREFFARCPQAKSLMRLFDALPQTYFFAKDRDSRFVAVNHMFLDNHGLTDEAQAIGKSDRDLHPPLMAEAYIAEDRRVMQSRQPLPGQVWAVLHRRTAPRWYVCTKTPIFGPDDAVLGIAGAMYRIDDPKVLTDYFQELMPVVRHVDRHFATTVSMAEMAKLAGLSTTHFNRRFRQLLRMTPSQYLRTVRVQHARGLLTTTDKPLTAIAALTGFTDQSHFTRRFRQTTGLTPEAYRRRFRQ
ncbi:MAG: AraC family transcriptional regulator [Planctomycetia bacterium]|nr:AraC family transcriptional regulator [Planctomycetia bacterium]